MSARAGAPSGQFGPGFPPKNNYWESQYVVRFHQKDRVRNPAKSGSRND
jgi:hypothetical protein